MIELRVVLHREEARRRRSPSAGIASAPTNVPTASDDHRRSGGRSAQPITRL